MSLLFIALLIIFGLSLIIANRVVMKENIILISGIVFLLISLLWTWQIFGVVQAVILGVTCTIIILIAGNILKGRSAEEQTTVNVQAGDKGSAVTSLRPQGTIRLKGINYRATATGQNIPPNYPVEVVSVNSDGIIVRPVI